MRLRHSILSLLLLLSGSAFATNGLILESPDKKLFVGLRFVDNKPMYAVYTVRDTLVFSSPLGLTVNETNLFTGLSFRINSQRQEVESRPDRGIASSVSARISIYLIDVGSGKIEFRVFNDGIAFRYLLPAGTKRINAEASSFRPLADAKVWFFERLNDWKLKSYAGWWMNTTLSQLGTISPSGPVQGKPLVFQYSDSSYLFITEAALYNYSGMRLRAAGNNLTVDYSEGKAGFNVPNDLTHTPWRVIGIASKLNDLVNNPLVRLLNPMPDSVLFADQSYIREGRSVWSWISRGKDYMSVESERAFIDAASILKFEYTLIDDGWEKKWSPKWDVLKDMVAYGKAKGVNIWVWKDSKQIRDVTTRDRFLDSVKMTGAVGIKTDFMNSESVDLIQFEIDLLEAAAKRKLMVNFHGCHTSTGESVRFPNEMTREGIRGMELNIMKEPIPAWHNAALPFTRFLTGHGDYTPGFFSNPGNSTLTHQLALLYLFNSPFQCIAEDPRTLVESKLYAPIVPLLQTLPVSWDETIVLPQSRIGEIAAIAKRKGRDWYIAIINGTDTIQNFELAISFITESRHRLTIVDDFQTGFAVKKSSGPVPKNLSVELKPTGGKLIHLKPI